MKHWIVVEYDAIDVTPMGGDRQIVPGEPCGAELVWASSEQAAVRKQAQPDRFYAAMPVPDGLTLHRTTLELGRVAKPV
jgi:hypothetical protein